MQSRHYPETMAPLVFMIGWSIVGAARPYPEVTVIDANSAPDTLTQALQAVNYTTFLPSRYYELASEHDKNALNWFSVSCGGLHTCGIKRYHSKAIARSGSGNFRSDAPDDAPGQLFCWGMNKYGQTNIVRPFGLPDTAECGFNPQVTRGVSVFDLLSPEPGTSESKLQECFDWDDGYRNVSTGFLHTCGILADGRMFCWGNNLHNELGTGELFDNETEAGIQPVCTDPENPTHSCQTTFLGRWALTRFGGVSAGKHQTCAIRCVENPSQRILYEDVYSAQGSLPNQWDTVPPSTCTEGEVVCWGKDHLAQTKTGLAEVIQDNLPDGETFTDVVSVCTAEVHSCAVRKNGQIYCWGFNGNNRAALPERLQLRKWTAVRCSGSHTCALAMPDQFGRSSLECWGFNGHGQTLVPRYTSRINVDRNGSTVPEVRRLVYDRSFLQFDTGDFNTCALWEMTSEEQSCDATSQRSPALNGECWGDGSYSQNNLPSRPVDHEPKNLCNMMQWKLIATGSYHSCAITIDDAGSTCAKDSDCSDYPPPYGNNINYDRCARGTKIFPEARECVPTRTNLLRCWGLNSDGQAKVPNSGPMLRAYTSLLLLPVVLALSHSRVLCT